jgi:hypothetical protein
MIDVQTELTNADDEVLKQIGGLYAPTGTVQVYTLEGAAPYPVSARICGGLGMSLNVIEGDAIPWVEQPALSIGENASVAATSVGEEQLLVFPLDVPVGDVFTVDARFINRSRSDDYPMYAAVVRDANGHVVASDFSERLPLTYIVTAPVYTVAGPTPYRLELAAIPLYNAGYAERFGEFPTDNISYSVELQPGNTAIVDGGVLTSGTRVEGVFDTRPVIYTVEVGEGEVFTLRNEYTQTPLQSFLNADGEQASVVTSFVNGANGRIWVMSLNGPPPYTLHMQGEGSYALLIEEGSNLSGNELGTLAPGEALQVTVPPQDDQLDYITLDVNPGTTVTLHWGVPQKEFPVRDGANIPIFSLNDDWNDGYGIYDLSQGTPPFTVSLDNPILVGETFTFTLAEGETPLSPDGATTAGTSTNTETETQSGADTACTVSANSNVNQRSGPGTDFDVSGTLAGGSSAGVDGQTTGTDGFTWYRLTTGAWVRGDLVTAGAGCSEVPEVSS